MATLQEQAQAELLRRAAIAELDRRKAEQRTPISEEKLQRLRDEMAEIDAGFHVTDPTDPLGFAPPEPVFEKGRLDEVIDRVAAGLANVGSAAAQMGAYQADRPFMQGPFGPRIEARPQEAKKLRESAKKLHDIAADPALAAERDDPLQTVLNLGAETIPFITATTIGTIGAGPLGGFAVASMVEGNSAYQTALSEFELGGVVTERERQIAKNVGMGVGVISGAIESVGGKFADELLVRATARIRSKLLRTGAQLSVGAIIEGLEEGSQEITQIAGEDVYRDVDWRAETGRVLDAFKGGVIVGGPARVVSAGARQVTRRPEADFEQTSLFETAEPQTKETFEELEVTPRSDDLFRVTEAEVGGVDQATARQRRVDSLVDEGLTLQDAESVTMTEQEFKDEQKRIKREEGPAGQISARLDTLKKKNPTHGARKRAGRIMRGLTKIRDTFSSYLLKQDRMFQLARMLDGYDENGPFTTHVYRKVVGANQTARDNLQNGMMQIREQMNDAGIDLTALSKDVRKDIAGGFPLSGTERIGMYMLAQNENGRRRVESVFADEDIDNAKAVEEVVASVENDPQLKRAADILHTYIDSRSPDFFAAAEQMGIEVKPEENYLMLMTLDPSEVDAPPIANAFRERFGVPVKTKGEARTKHRTKTRAKAKYDVMQILPSMIQSVEQFTAAGPAMMEVEKTLNDNDLRKKLNNATRGQGVGLVRNWLSQSARGSIDHGNMPFEHTARVLRKNAVQYLLGFKAFSVVPKQAVSASNAIGLRPALAPGIFLRLARYGDMGVTGALESDFNRVAKLSKMMRNRDWERDMRRTFGEKNTKRFFKGKKLSPLSMRMTSYVDRATATSVWLSAFDKAMSDNNGDTNLAVQYADDVVTQTQPMGNVEELPEYFRGGLLSQAITTFQGQPSQNWNFLRHNILGELRAGKISKARAMQRFVVGQVVPAMMLGIITRGRLPNDAEEVGLDIASHLITPWAFFGRWIFNAATGQWDPEESAVSAIPLRSFEEASRGITAAKEGDARKVAERAIGAVGAATGKIPQQIIITTGGVLDLAEGETEDLRRLIYSKYKIEKVIDEDED